jgi:hypothetical protein
MSKFKIGQKYDHAFEEMPKQEIEQNLEAIAYGVEERSYTKNLTESELEEKKDEYAEIGIKLSELEEEKKEFLDNFKLKTKEPKTKSGILLNAIKYKSEQVHGKLHLIDDQESGMMYYFDTTGTCVDARPLFKNERQMKLKSVINE